MRLKLFLFLSIVFCSTGLHAQQITPRADTTNIKVETNGNAIFNNGERIGTFRERTIDDGLISVQVYNNSYAKVAEVTHEINSPTWTIITPVDQKKMYAPYYHDIPHMALFRYLIIKGYL